MLFCVKKLIPAFTIEQKKSVLFIMIVALCLVNDLESFWTLAT